ncbi:hypothetical protein KHQ81_06445 [Mycoplasmatota bacterium]|nr:hypothetical protein KHQ81_06445 [Mycoplasmatota bacterium]
MINAVNYNPNGFIIKRIDGDDAKKYKNYHGIDGDSWPIDKYTKGLSINDINILSNYLDEYFMKFYYNKDAVGACCDIKFLNSYIDACIKADFNIELLFCETKKSTPICTINPEAFNRNFIFIGFDYGYPEDDYYSCVYNDVNRFSEMAKLKLNKYGLF